MPSDRGPLQTGQRFAGCVIERRLGGGAMGAVYAAFDETAATWRALKVFAPAAGGDPAADAEARRRFVAEMALSTRLRHPDIVQVHGAGESGGLAWLLMDLLPGTDLTRYTQAARLLPDAVVIALGERLARALAHAHGLGIVHRDLKPANVMVDWAGDRVTLTDFGIARSADAEATRTGLVLGSPAYMAPELLAGAPPSAHSDLYALGVLLFQLLTGRLPFDAPGLGELLRQVATQPAPDLDALRPGTAAGLAALVAALLAKTPQARPADAAAAAAALAGLRSSGPGA
jgi:serine/threonine-protein kinase